MSHKADTLMAIQTGIPNYGPVFRRTKCKSATCKLINFGLADGAVKISYKLHSAAGNDGSNRVA
jgi:hypothetical protein